ncbi:MAG: antibiotic biosynthesis monooxygenase, partial [Candidatus Binatia bacterium]
AKRTFVLCVDNRTDVTRRGTLGARLHIAKTPAPPYYAVIAPTVLSGDASGFPELAQRLTEMARGVDGFLDIESCFHGNFVLAVSYWRSLEAIEVWRQHARHQYAKNMGKARWFEAYFTRIARVEHDY